MVRSKQVMTGTVKLKLMGPKSIIPKPIIANARLSQTWLELLNGRLRLKVDTQSGIFVCSSEYTPRSPKEGKGWRCELDQPIRDFVGKFKKRHSKIPVRLINPNGNGVNDNVNLSENGTLGVPPTTIGARRHPHAPKAKKPSATGPCRAMNITPIVPPQGTFPSNQQPNIVIHTIGLMGPPPPPPPTQSGTLPGVTPRSTGEIQGRNNNASLSIGLMGPPPPPPPAPGPSSKNFQKPRYHNANGSTPQQAALRSGEIQGRSGNASTSNVKGRSQELRIRTKRTGALQAPAAAVASLSAVQVEPVVQAQFERFWDEFSGVIGQEAGGANGNNGSGGGAAAANAGGGQQEEEEVAGGSDETGAADEEDDDNLSLVTAAIAQEDELRREGIQVEDIKPLVHRQFSRFSNNYMLRVKNEIEKLKQDDTWVRNVNRSPLACYLLQELLK